MAEEEGTGGMEIALQNATEIGAGMREVIEMPDGDLLLVREGYEVQDVSHLHARPRPPRTKASTQHEVAQSLALYANRFAIPDTSVVYVSDQARSITLVVDHHEPGHEGPRWRDHQAWFRARLSDRYVPWKTIQGKFVQQEEFANWIEDHLEDIIFPEAASVLEVIETMQATIGGRFRKILKRDSGTATLQYDEQVDVSAGTAGILAVPRRIKIAVPIFEGGSLVDIEVALRFRLEGGAVRWGIQMFGVSELEKRAWDRVVQDDFIANLAAEVAQGVRIYVGSVGAEGPHLGKE